MPRWVRASRCAAMLVVAGLMAMPRVLTGHPIHTTYSVLTRDGPTVTLQLRAFADDLSAAVARHHGRPAPADSSAPHAETYRYLAATLPARSASGEVVPLTPCGVRRAEHLTFVCLQLPRGASALRLSNSVLTELHGDQVNIVQVTGGATLLFTRATAAQTLRY